MDIAWAQSKDADDIQNVFEQAVMGIDATIYSLAQKRAWIARANHRTFWKDYLHAHPILGAWDHQQRLLGFSSFHRAYCYLDLLFIAPNAQGQGVASTLWQSTLAPYYPATRWPRLFTHASEAGRAFFSTMGFVVLKQRLVTIETQQLCQYWMMHPGR